MPTNENSVTHEVSLARIKQLVTEAEAGTKSLIVLSVPRQDVERVRTGEDRLSRDIACRTYLTSTFDVMKAAWSLVDYLVKQQDEEGPTDTVVKNGFQLARSILAAIAAGIADSQPSPEGTGETTGN